MNENLLHVNGAEIIRLAKVHGRAFNIQFLKDSWGRNKGLGIKFNHNHVAETLKYLCHIQCLEVDPRGTTYSMLPKVWDIESSDDFETAEERKQRKQMEESREIIMHKLAENQLKEVIFQLKEIPKVKLRQQIAVWAAVVSALAAITSIFF